MLCIFISEIKITIYTITITEDEGIWNLYKALFKKYVRDRDKPIKTVGITGLKENFRQDDGIEEPYWGSSIKCFYSEAEQIIISFSEIPKLDTQE